jgi:hypothetical protein
VTGPRKRDGRSGYRLHLINLHWRARPPANGNHEQPPAASSAGAHDLAFCIRARCQTCADIATTTRRRQARQLWLCGAQLCAAAALCRAAGRFLMAEHAIDQTCVVLRRRAAMGDVKLAGGDHQDDN